MSSFLTSRDDNCSKASPSCNTPPDIISFFQERFQLGESTALRTHHDDDGPVSPTASPRCSDGVASSTGHGVALQFAEELEMIKRQPHQGTRYKRGARSNPKALTLTSPRPILQRLDLGDTIYSFDHIRISRRSDNHLLLHGVLGQAPKAHHRHNAEHGSSREESAVHGHPHNRRGHRCI